MANPPVAHHSLKKQKKGCWNKPYLSSCGNQSPNGNFARRFPEPLKKRSLHLLNPSHLRSQAFVGYILKIIESGKINCAGTEKISNKPLEGDRGRVVICNTHHFTEALELRQQPIQKQEENLGTFDRLRQRQRLRSKGRKSLLVLLVHPFGSSGNLG